MATRNDVARLAGVSTATVSYYINSSGYVSKQTGEKIALAIKELEYRPNLIAKSLKVKDSKQFVFLCNEIRNPFHAEIAYAVAEIAYKNDYLTLFCNAIDDNEYIKKICLYQVSGVFIASPKVSRDIIKLISDSNIPIVFLDDSCKQEFKGTVSKININLNDAIEQLINHVVKNGAKNICYISSASGDSLDHGRDGKVVAFKKHIKKHSGTVLNSNIVENITTAKDAFEFATTTYKDIKKIPDCFICANDAVASGIIRAVYNLGLKVPQDVMVTGFDNTTNSKMSIPSLTTVDISMDEISRSAMNLLLKKCNKEQAEDVTISAKIIVRESTKRKQ